MCGGASPSMLGLGQPIMIGWLTAAHEPLSELAHARAPRTRGEWSRDQQGLFPGGDPGGIGSEYVSRS